MTSVAVTDPDSERPVGSVRPVPGASGRGPMGDGTEPAIPVWV